MRILLVNDDGYDSVGLKAVADLFKKEHDVTVVAPDSQKSGYSHAVTLYPNTLLWRKVKSDINVYAVNGTPVDCVKIGLSYFAPDPDLVISGINRGQNLGTDILYSGTVSIASDAACLGYRAVALSVLGSDPDYDAFVRCAKFAMDNLKTIASYKLPPQTFININFPDCKPLGVRVAKMCTSPTYQDAYDDSDGAMNVVGSRAFDKMQADTDEALCRAGYVTVSPLKIDMTDHAVFKKMKKEKFVL